MHYVVIDSQGRYLTVASRWSAGARHAQRYASRAKADAKAAALGASVELARDERQPLPM